MQGSATFLIAFAAGNFIYIAGSDLIPELHKEEPKPLKSALQLIAFVLGVLILLSLTFLERVTNRANTINLKAQTYPNRVSGARDTSS